MDIYFWVNSASRFLFACDYFTLGSLLVICACIYFSESFRPQARTVGPFYVLATLYCINGIVLAIKAKKFISSGLIIGLTLIASLGALVNSAHWFLDKPFDTSQSIAIPVDKFLLSPAANELGLTVLESDTIISRLGMRMIYLPVEGNIARYGLTVSAASFGSGCDVFRFTRGEDASLHIDRARHLCCPHPGAMSRGCY